MIALHVSLNLLILLGSWAQNLWIFELLDLVLKVWIVMHLLSDVVS